MSKDLLATIDFGESVQIWRLFLLAMGRRPVWDCWPTESEWLGVHREWRTLWKDFKHEIDRGDLVGAKTNSRAELDATVRLDDFERWIGGKTGERWDPIRVAGKRWRLALGTSLECGVEPAGRTAMPKHIRPSQSTVNDWYREMRLPRNKQLLAEGRGDGGIAADEEAAREHFGSGCRDQVRAARRKLFSEGTTGGRRPGMRD